MKPKPLCREDILIKRKNKQYYKYVRLEKLKLAIKYLRDNMCDCDKVAVDKCFHCEQIDKAFEGVIKD